MPRKEVQADPAGLAELCPQASPLAEAGVEARERRKRPPGGVPRPPWWGGFRLSFRKPPLLFVRVLLEVQRL